MNGKLYEILKKIKEQIIQETSLLSIVEERESQIEPNLQAQVKKSAINFIQCKNMENQVDTLSNENPDFSDINNFRYILCPNSKEQLSDGYFAIQTILRELYNKHESIIALLTQVAINSNINGGDIDLLSGDFLRFIEDDMNGQGSSLNNTIHIICEVIEKISLITKNSSYDIIQKNEFINSLISHFMDKKEIVLYVKSLFTGISKFFVEQSDSIDHFIDSPKKSNIMGDKREENDFDASATFLTGTVSKSDIEVIIVITNHLFTKISTCIKEIPTSLKKLICALLNYSTNVSQERSIICDFFIFKLISKIALQPNRYNLLDSCIFSKQYNFYISSMIKIIKKIFEGNLLSQSDILASNLNSLINNLLPDSQQIIANFLKNKFKPNYSPMPARPLMVIASLLSVRSLKVIVEVILKSLDILKLSINDLQNSVKRITMVDEYSHILNPVWSEQWDSKEFPNTQGYFNKIVKYFLITRVEITNKEIKAPYDSIQKKILYDLFSKIKIPGELELYNIDSLKNALKLIRKYPQIYGYKAESKMNIILQTSYLINQLKEEKNEDQLLNGLIEDQNRKIILINEYIAYMNTLIGLVSNNLNLFTEKSSQQKIEIETEVLQKLRANYFIRNATLDLSFTKDNKIEFGLQINKDSSPSSKAEQKIEAKPLSIKQFIKCYLNNKEEFEKIILTKEDPNKKGEEFVALIDFLKKSIEKAKYFEGLRSIDLDLILDEVLNYLTNKIYIYCYPNRLSSSDLGLYTKSMTLNWITHVMLGIKAEDINEEMWQESINEMKKIDEYMTPMAKLSCINKACSILSEGLFMFSNRKEPPGADDCLPLFIYMILSSKLQRLHSTMNYINLFCNPNKMMAQFGYSFVQFNAAVQYIEIMDEEAINMNKLEYYSKMYDEALKFGLLPFFDNIENARISSCRKSQKRNSGSKR